MITLKRLEWDNWFSYGSGNKLDLSNSKLTQIKGKNGSGKTSIPLIIEEVLFGRNFRNIKKPNIPNRNIKKPVLSASLFLEVDELDIEIRLKRASSLSLNLVVDGKDISSHTSSATYKTIENLLGIDYLTFSQIVYQSSTTGLKFLTDTDSNRKKFLINLLNLDEYVKVFNTFKDKTKQLNNEIMKLEGSCESILEWIKRAKSKNLNKLSPVEVPKKPKDAEDRLVDIRSKLESISTENRRIAINNKYKELLDKIPSDMLSKKIQEVDENTSEELKKNVARLQAEIKLELNKVQKLEKLDAVCPTCMQEIDTEVQQSLLDKSREIIESNDEEIKRLVKELDLLIEITKSNREIKKYQNEFITIKNSIDYTLPETTYSEKDLEDEYDKMSAKLAKIDMLIKEATAHNTKVAENNSRVDIIKEQLEEHENQLELARNNLNNLKEQYNKADIIKKTFSTNGVISYKIESIIKELEDQINNYLQALSRGRFQLEFSVAGEKLNISIIDEGNKVDIQELSAGELSKVNASTLLAIRRLLSAISKTSINILFLDEIMGVLDSEGQELLIEVLLNENSLNTFLVSHDYSHPLLEYVQIERVQGLSKL